VALFLLRKLVLLDFLRRDAFNRACQAHEWLQGTDHMMQIVCRMGFQLRSCAKWSRLIAVLKSGERTSLFPFGHCSDRSSTNLVDLFLNGSAHTTFIHVGIAARPCPIGQFVVQQAAEG
jgi:hypothetical protein